MLVKKFKSYVISLGFFLFLTGNLSPVLADNDSTVCEPMSPTGTSTCSLSYDEAESLSYNDVTLEDGAISGSFNASVYVQPTASQCVYIQLQATSDIVAQAYGVSSTIINKGDSTAWCQYQGIGMECPFTNLGELSFSVPNVGSFNNSFSIAGILNLTSDIPFTLSLNWNITGNVSCVGSLGSANIQFPLGGFSDFVTANAIDATNEVSGCQPPSS